MSNIQTGAERMPHDLSHLGFLAGQIGRLITISTTPVIAGDSFEMDAVGALRLSPLRRGLAIDSTVDIFTFYVPHRHVYGEQWIKFMKDVVNATPLPTVNTTGYIDHAAFLGTIKENLPRFAWSTPQRQKLKFLPLRRYNLTLNLLSRSHDRIASGRQIAINGHIKFNLTIPLQQLNGLETLVIIMVANKYAFLQITRRRFLNEWEAFKKVISRRNIRRRITIPLTLSNLKLLRRI